MNEYRRLWIALAVVIGGSFAVLGGVGSHLISHAPPIPRQVIASNGQVLFSGSDILEGQGVWQSIGGQEIGTVWSHGAYLAPDWTADWLHREALFILNAWAENESAESYNALSFEKQAVLGQRLKETMRRNTYRGSDGTITVPPVRATAFSALENYYAHIFSAGSSLPAMTPTPFPEGHCSIR